MRIKIESFDNVPVLEMDKMGNYEWSVKIGLSSAPSDELETMAKETAGMQFEAREY